MRMIRNAVALAVGAVIGAGSAMAALPTDVTTAFTALETDGGTLMTAVWGVVTIITLGFVYIKLFKKGVNKAT